MRPKSPTLAAALATIAIHHSAASPGLDLGGDGMSDVWQALYSGIPQIKISFDFFIV